VYEGGGKAAEAERGKAAQEEGEQPAETAGEAGAAGRQKDDWWYLRIPGGKIYGTFPLATFREWAAQGRVAPDNEVSQDREDWQPVHALEGIGMHWTVLLKNGNEYGPFNILATPILVERGIITRGSVVENKATGKRIPVAQLLKIGEPPAEEKAPVAEEKKAPVAQEKKAPVAQEKKAPVAQEKKAPVAQEKKAPVAEEKKAPVAEEKKAPVAEEKKAPAEERAAEKVEPLIVKEKREPRQTEERMKSLRRLAVSADQKLSERVTQIQQELGGVRADLQKEREARVKAERLAEQLRDDLKTARAAGRGPSALAPVVPQADPVARLLADWYLKMDDGSIYGPTKLSELREWAGQSRIDPECEISVDREQWVHAREVPEFCMDWLVVLDDGSENGPFNLSVIVEMVYQKVLRPSATVRHRFSGKRWRASSVVKPEFACLQDRIGTLERQLDAATTAREERGVPGIPGRSVAAQIRQRQRQHGAGGE